MTATQATPETRPPATTRHYTVDIDIGGTLTDGLFSDGAAVTPVKVDTTPHDFTVCFFNCLREGASQLGYDDLTAFLAEVAVIRWSATIATNIIAERKGPRIGLLVSAGTGPELYGSGESPAIGRLVRTEDIVTLGSDASESQTLAAIRELLSKGVRRIAVSIGGSFTDDSSEQAVKRLVDENFPDHFLGAVPLVLGSEICRHPDDQTRTHMALVNAYVHTPLAVALFKAEDQLLGEHAYKRPVYIAHVNGGVARVAKTKAVDTAESSPYFGLRACGWWARQYGRKRVLALDVGGTTSKLGVIIDGEPLTIDHGELLGVPLKTPWTLLRSEAVGGGSVAAAADGAVTLGPESQGAFPGPACYDLGGGKPTLTDAFLVSGMLNPERFLGGRRQLRTDLAQAALRGAVAEPLRTDGISAAGMVVDRAAEMVAAVARSTLELADAGTDDFTLFCFGGNGGNFAAGVADRLGLDEAYVFALGPVLSAFGSSVSQIVHIHEEHPFADLGAPVDDDLAAALQRGYDEVVRDLRGEGLSVADATFSCELVTSHDGSSERRTVAPEAAALRAALDEVRAAGGGVVDRISVRGSSAVPCYEPVEAAQSPYTPEPSGSRTLRGQAAQVLVWEDLRPGASATGPALLESETNSCAIPAGWGMQIDGHGNAVLRRATQRED